MGKNANKKPKWRSLDIVIGESQSAKRSSSSFSQDGARDRHAATPVAVGSTRVNSPPPGFLKVCSRSFDGLLRKNLVVKPSGATRQPVHKASLDFLHCDPALLTGQPIQYCRLRRRSNKQTYFARSISDQSGQNMKESSAALQSHPRKGASNDEMYTNGACNAVYYLTDQKVGVPYLIPKTGFTPGSQRIVKEEEHNGTVYYTYLDKEDGKSPNDDFSSSKSSNHHQEKTLQTVLPAKEDEEVVPNVLPSHGHGPTDMQSSCADIKRDLNTTGTDEPLDDEDKSPNRINSEHLSRSSDNKEQMHGSLQTGQSPSPAGQIDHPAPEVTMSMTDAVPAASTPPFVIMASEAGIQGFHYHGAYLHPVPGHLPSHVHQPVSLIAADQLLSSCPPPAVPEAFSANLQPRSMSTYPTPEPVQTHTHPCCPLNSQLMAVPALPGLHGGGLEGAVPPPGVQYVPYYVCYTLPMTSYQPAVDSEKVNQPATIQPQACPSDATPQQSAAASGSIELNECQSNNTINAEIHVEELSNTLHKINNKEASSSRKQASEKINSISQQELKVPCETATQERLDRELWPPTSPKSKAAVRHSSQHGNSKNGSWPEDFELEEDPADWGAQDQEEVQLKSRHSNAIVARQLNTSSSCDSNHSLDRDKIKRKKRRRREASERKQNDNDEDSGYRNGTESSDHEDHGQVQGEDEAQADGRPGGHRRQASNRLSDKVFEFPEDVDRPPSKDESKSIDIMFGDLKFEEIIQRCSQRDKSDQLPSDKPGGLGVKFDLTHHEDSLLNGGKSEMALVTVEKQDLNTEPDSIKEPVEAITKSEDSEENFVRNELTCDDDQNVDVELVIETKEIFVDKDDITGGQTDVDPTPKILSLGNHPSQSVLRPLKGDSSGHPNEFEAYDLSHIQEEESWCEVPVKRKSQKHLDSNKSTSKKVHSEVKMSKEADAIFCSTNPFVKLLANDSSNAILDKTPLDKSCQQPEHPKSANAHKHVKRKGRKTTQKAKADVPSLSDESKDKKATQLPPLSQIKDLFFIEKEVEIISKKKSVEAKSYSSKSEQASDLSDAKISTNKGENESKTKQFGKNNKKLSKSAKENRKKSTKPSYPKIMQKDISIDIHQNKSIVEMNEYNTEKSRLKLKLIDEEFFPERQESYDKKIEVPAKSTSSLSGQTAPAQGNKEILEPEEEESIEPVLISTHGSLFSPSSPRTNIVTCMNIGVNVLNTDLLPLAVTASVEEQFVQEILGLNTPNIGRRENKNQVLLIRDKSTNVKKTKVGFQGPDPRRSADDSMACRIPGPRIEYNRTGCFYGIMRVTKKTAVPYSVVSRFSAVN